MEQVLMDLGFTSEGVWVILDFLQSHKAFGTLEVGNPLNLKMRPAFF
jgi:hypothetical protein